MKPRHEFSSSKEFKAAVVAACVAVLEERGTATTTELAKSAGIKSFSVSRILRTSKLFEVAGRSDRGWHPRKEIVWCLRLTRA